MLFPKIYTWLVLLCFGFASTLYASESIFKNYSIAEGLVHKSVTNILQDSDGFIWIGTTNGLSRFDSYEFKNFTHFDNKRTALQGTTIEAIIEGKDGKRIWFSTDAGLEYFDKETEIFCTVSKPRIKGNVFRGFIAMDNDGNMWIQHKKNEFIVYNPTIDSVFDSEINLPLETLGDEEFTIYNYSIVDNVIWIASDKGVAYYNIGTKQFNWFERSTHMHCSKIKKVNDSLIAFTYMFEGIYIVNTSSLSSRWIWKSFIEDKIGTQTTFYDATAENDSTFWISVAPGLVKVEGSNVEYYNYFSSSRYFEGNVVSCLYCDHDNNIWAGTYENGFFLKKKRNRNFSYTTRLHHDDEMKTHISNFHVFKNNTLLYGDSKGIYSCEDYNNLSMGCAKRILDASIPRFYPIDDQYCMISSMDSFYVYDSKESRLTFSHTSIAPSCVFKDANGTLWIGSWSGRVYGYDKFYNKKHEIFIGLENKMQFPVFTILGDPDGSLWLGTIGLGLVHVKNPTSNKPIKEPYNQKGVGNNYLNSNMVHCLHFDKDSNLWIGTNGTGLVKLDWETKKLSVFTTEHGLKSNVIESITSDNDGNIWFASEVITKYDVKANTFTHFLQSEGIEGSFIAKACSKSESGDLLFASSSGLYVFNPKTIKEDNLAPSPIFTGFRIRGVPVNTKDTIDGFTPYKKSITFSDEISLPYSLNSFSITFASLRYQESQMIDYQFKLDGIDENWIPAKANNRIASYVGLQPGSYTFLVRASYDSGLWSAPATIVVHIIPPWWKTLWFKVVFFLFITIVISSIIIYRFRNIKKLNLLLEGKVRQRTDKLTEANKMLRENHLVLKMKNEEISETLKAKDKLIRIIAHDFKNPLAAIMGYISFLKEKILQFDIETIQEMLNDISASTSNLQLQMVNVLDWALAEKQEITYKPTEINIETLISDAIELVKESAEQKNITLTVQLDYETNSFVDTRMISTVIRNLLINAIKFTPNNGSVAVVVQEYESDLEISVIDSGIGMSKDKIDNIFNSENPISTSDTDNIKSTGLGLQLSKSFVEANKGTINARSQVDRGTVFTFTVPKGKGRAIKQELTHRSNISHNQPELPITLKEDKNVTVLIIDDNVNVVKLLTKVFEQYYRVVSAVDGQSGIQIASNVVPSIIISDIAMPKVSGIDLCRALKEDEVTGSIPIILITADEHLMNEGYASGADDFIVKPFNENELLLKAFSLLENRKRLASQQNETAGQRSFIMPESFNDIVVGKLLSYVNDHFCEPDIDTAKIGEKVGLSRTQLWRKFKSATDQNLSDYIKNLRLAKAREMLLTGRYKVSEVGYEVGFSNPQYFSKCFVKHFGYTPKECVNNKEE